MSETTAEEQLEHALGLAFRYLNRRERTRDEVRRQLERGSVAPETIGQALERLAELGYLDDARFARVFVADKRTLEGWGSERIRRGLVARSVSRELIEAALAEEPEDEDEDASEAGRARALLERRFPEPPRDRRERERALGVLLRRGYESELAIETIIAYSRSRD